MNRRIDDGVASRVEALEILLRWMETGDFPDRLLDGVAPARRGFVMELVYATVRWVRAIEYVIAPRLRQTPIAEAEAALLLGGCQLLILRDIPAYAALHTTVEALKIVGPRLAPIRLVNAVLRDIERNLDRDLDSLARSPLALRTSHPDDLVAQWTARWGEERAAAICDWNNQPAEVNVLTLPHGPTRDELESEFLQAGIKVEPHPAVPEALVLGHGVRVFDLPGFADGAFAIQDPATLEAVRLLQVAPGQRVLDACAAPGGKAARIARLLQGQGELVALERHADRLPLLRETLERLAPGRNVTLHQADATRVEADDLGGKFDRILLDVPCSNSGVLRRRPDARWRVDPARTSQLIRLQRHLLDNAAHLLAPGGRLVYSTCSIDAAENEEQIAAFLKRYPQFRLADFATLLPPGTDGAYAAALEM